MSDVANLNQYLALWAPGTGITSADIPSPANDVKLFRRGNLRKRDFGDFFTGLVRVMKAVVEIVVAVVQAAVKVIRYLAETLLPTWHPSASFTIPVDLGPINAQLEDCPWGEDCFEIYSYIAGREEGDFNYGLSAGVLAKMTGADQILTFDIDGVEQLPVPGVKVWCVDCGIHGSIKTTGSATFTIIGITRLGLRLQGDLNANVQLGVDGFYRFERPVFQQRLFTEGLPGFAIPDIISIGPYLSIDIAAVVKVETIGQILAGVNLHWPKIGMFVDFMDFGSAKSYGYAPIVTPVFKASGNVTVTAQLGLPVGINIGVDILNGVFEKSIALVDTPAVEAVAEYSVSYDSTTGQTTVGKDGCAGIHFYSDLVNKLELQIFDEYKVCDSSRFR